MVDGRLANERRGLILKAVDTFLKVHDDWEADVHGPPQPSEHFERAVKICIEICERGDQPEDCRALVGAVAKMGVEWILYENGKMGSDHRPTKAFWDAVRDVKTERVGAIPFAPRVRETVKMLLEQKVSPEQIARANFADPEWANGYGPFLDARGATNYGAIEAERRANEKGETTLPADWVHPDDRNRKRAADESARIRLAQLQGELAKANSSKEDPESLLREGQFANVVARICGLTLDEVNAIAARIGVTAEQTPNLAATRGAMEPEINEASDRALQPHAPAFEEPAGETPAQQITRMRSQGFDDEAIAEKLGVTPRKLYKLAGAGV